MFVISLNRYDCWCAADMIVTSLKAMRGDGRWAGAIIAFEEGRWCTQAGLDKTATVQQLRSRLAKLSNENWLPPAKLLWIEELLSGSPSLVSIHGQHGFVLPGQPGIILGFSFI